MNTTKDKAIQSFQSGMNCAQAVVTAYAVLLKFDPDLAAGLSCGFGGGMGRLQQTCGALTGAFMVLGIHNSRLYTDRAELKNVTYTQVRKINEKFRQRQGATDCRSLLGCDLQTDEGMQYHKDTNQSKMICEKCIAASIELLDEIVGD